MELQGGGRGGGVGHHELTTYRDEILRVGRSHGATNIRVFGSFARGTAGPESDVDFLVELEPGRSLLDLVALIRELGALLGRRADVTTARALHPLLFEEVRRERAIRAPPARAPLGFADRARSELAGC